MWLANSTCRNPIFKTTPDEIHIHVNELNNLTMTLFLMPFLSAEAQSIHVAGAENELTTSKHHEHVDEIHSSGRYII